MNNRILSIFGLQGLKVSKVIEYYRQIFIYVYPERKTANCPSCSKRSKCVHDYKKISFIKHLKIGKRQTYLAVSKRRFFCKYCKKPFTEKLPVVDKWQRHTKSLENEIIETLRESSFRSVARRFGVNYKTQVKLLKHTMKPFEGSWEEEKRSGKPISVGIDEHSFSGRDMCITVTNLTTPSLKSILPDDTKKTLDSFFSKIPGDVKSQITSFCIDMKKMYKFSIKRNFPNAKIVIDHFHLIYDANRRCDEERRITQEMKGVKMPKKLFLKNKEGLSDTEKDLITSYFAKYPDIKFYWHIKESLRDMYKLRQRNAAGEKLNSLIRIMYRQKERGLTQWANTLEYWKDEILNFYDYRITNAYTEGIHTKLKLIKRIGFGFRNKEVYIRKAALACLPITFLPHFIQ